MMDEEKSVQKPDEGTDVASSRSGVASRMSRAKRFAAMLLVVCASSMMAVASASAESGGSGGGDMSSITGAFSTVTSLVSSVFSMITGNPLLAVFVAIGLFGAGIGLFRKLKRASH